MKQKLILLLLKYFRFFARLQLLKINPTIIGVTGSAGKTSTRDAIYAVIQKKFNVKVSYKANSESGIPLNILGLTPSSFSLLEWIKLALLCPVQLLINWEKYDIYLVEMGIDSPDEPKNMEYLLTIVTPDIGVFLNAAPMHSEPFDYLVKSTSIEERAKEVTKLIAQEKGKIVTRLDSTKTAVLNIDQAELAELVPQISANLISFGKNEGAHVKITNYSISKKSTEFSFSVTEGKTQKNLNLSFQNLLLPEHFAYTFAAAISVGVSLKVPLPEIQENLMQLLELPPGRSSLIPGINGSTIIDSSYNASAHPTIEMLELLQKVPGKRKLALLGDIRELGTVAQHEHERVAKAAQVCDGVLLVGPQMKQFALPLLKQSKTQVHWFSNAYKAAEFLKSQLKSGDVLLVKGSQNTLLLEIAVEALMQNPEDANQLLARRGEFWDEKRAEIKQL